MVINWVFENLHLCVITGYYQKKFDNLIDTQLFDIDIDIDNHNLALI